MLLLMRKQQVLNSRQQNDGKNGDKMINTEKYTVQYNGHLFDGDTDGFNSHNYDRFEDAMRVYNMYPNVIIHDNEYGVTYENGDWH